MSWDTVNMSSIATCIQPGPFGSQLHSSDYSDEGTPIIMPKDMIDGRISHSDLAYVSEEHVRRLNRHQVHNGNLIVARKGDVRKCVFITESEEGWMTGSDCLKVALNEELCHPRFIFYQLRSPYIGRWLETISIGATMPSLNTGLLGSINLYLPPLDIQKRIANILFTYDALIETNQRQIKLLEEAAQRLYKEWFVDLRYPGHENVPVVEGVPMGWKKTSVIDCLEFHINGGWGKETPVGKNVMPGHVIRGTDINDIKSGHFDDVPLRYHTENDVMKRSLRVNDIVFELSNGNINNIGRTLLIDEFILESCGNKTICASFCKLFRPLDKKHAVILYWEIQDMQSSGRMLPFKKQGANGINNFAFDDFLEHEFLIPEDLGLLHYFEALMQKINNAQRQLAVLIEARDRLLPKLMSGEIAV